jgi:endonuclease/exonuclease/phosphatase family metal-dependent hydrolase
VRDVATQLDPGALRPLIVAGDLNEPAGGPAWLAWGEGIVDPAPDAPATFPAMAPRRRIDAVLAGPDVEVLAYGDGSADPGDVRAASDHLPVLAAIVGRRRARGVAAADII